MNEKTIVGLVVAGVLLLGVGSCSVVSVPKGHIGVQSAYGAVSDDTIPPGLHVMRPWRKLYRMNCQTRRNDEPCTVPTAGGIAVKIDATMNYHLNPAAAPRMARDVGDMGYEEVVIDPVFKNAVRDICAKYPAEMLNGPDRQKLETEIHAKVQAEFEGRGVAVEAIMLLDPVFPASLVERINAKAGAEQDVQRMEFVLKQKELEAKAKVVEAKGIADAQMIIKKDLDEQYLRYLWIQALKDNHAATIYVPVGNDGMPIFRRAEPAGK